MWAHNSKTADAVRDSQLDAATKEKILDMFLDLDQLITLAVDLPNISDPDHRRFAIDQIREEALEVKAKLV